MQRIFNKDGFNWWIGVVEDRNDPEKLGRVRIRIYGYHTDDKVLLPTVDLPWAIPIHPITSAASSGIGITPIGPLTGTWAFGFFLDGEDMQQPAFMGTIGTKTAELTFEEAKVKPETTNKNDGNLKDSSGNLVTDSDGNPTKSGVPAIDGWYVGQTTEETETSGRGGGSINDYENSNDIEGARYGAFELASFLPQFNPEGIARPSSKRSPIKTYLEFSKYKEFFLDLEPATSAFDAEWSSIGSTLSEEFYEDQRNYIQKAYYEVMISNLQRFGLDLTKFGPGVQDLVWSTAFQLGPNYVTVFTEPLLGKSLLTDRDIITLVSEYKIASIDIIFKSKSNAVKEQNRNRYQTEKTQLLSLVTV
jgi:hypothetical protein